ncbi:MAG TPA: MFS transporter, partial [Pyrinomonadaceae bacterium]|nr:MFS transporter [Pyrinomonadaceae bacterium]
MTSLTYMELLRGNRSFRRLLAGQVVSELGNWFNFIAVLGLVRAVANAAPEAMAVLVLLKFAPFAVFAPLAGAIADRWSRRAVMLWSDAARALLALGFLFVRRPEDLWIAYACTTASSLLAALFEGAKTAALPNVTGDRGLLAGNTLMYSSRFLLMSVGSALGGATALRFGYDAAFIVNALSFVVSAYSIWLIPGSELRAADAKEAGRGGADGEAERRGYWTDVREGWAYILSRPIIAALVGVNMMWAVDGGALNLIYDRLGGVVFAVPGGASADAGVSAIYATLGAGLFTAMLLGRRIGAEVELRNRTPGFIGWTLITHGLIFAVAGLMPSLWLACVMLFLSRFVIGVEFAVHDTLMMRLLPDGLRGRVVSTDRALEILVMSVTGILAGWSLYF